ncbi:MAG: UDP-N-acetylmuramoyl-tripeptide--D-alanyl-D-alanine ligase [Patescibacteria group bacterium]|nr:UDP-N-acetylmuramoyl-tripeptide--D-alanyl-D-alanine ligase [Patescibacteria group bacterium]
MKPFFKKILQYYLKYITKLVLAIHKPVIIAVAGSANKTFTRDEIRKVLEKRGSNARANLKSFNTEIGLPLAILNLPSGYNEYRNWLPAIKGALAALFETDFPKFLVLELGVSKKGDMKYLLSVISPEVSVITGITQRYIESFSGMDDLVGEYKILAKGTKRSGLVAVNGDNSRSGEVAKSSQAEILFYGKSEKCQAKILEIERGSNGEVAEISVGGKIHREELGRFGEHHIYARAAAILVDKHIQSV